MTVITLPCQWRALNYRYHDPRPRAGDGAAWTEWCIEEQLARALDQHPAVRALAMLAELSPRVDVERLAGLLDLADEVAKAQSWGRPELFYAAVDAYADALHALARDLRGVPVGVPAPDPSLVDAGCAVTWTAAADWVWSRDGAIVGDGYPTAAAAWADAAATVGEEQPVLCDRCGDQGVCPECRGV